MSAWIKVLTQPLGLAGFALFLVFSFVGRLRAGDKRRWIPAAAFSGAGIALAGGLVLAWLQLPRLGPPSIPMAAPAPSVTQSSTGDCSPNSYGNQGDLTVTCETTAVPSSPPVKTGK